MWWWFYRIAVDDTGALYEYGYENKTPTGEITYIKATGDIIIFNSEYGKITNVNKLSPPTWSAI
jgi:hypothetical protein